MDNTFIISIWKEPYDDKKGQRSKARFIPNFSNHNQNAYEDGEQYIVIFNNPDLRAQFGEFHIVKLRDKTWRYDDKGGLELLSVKINVIAILEIDS